MQTNHFEEAFSDFLDSSDYDKTEEFIYALTRAAFSAGWRAAGGSVLMPRRPLELFQKEGPR